MDWELLAVLLLAAKVAGDALISGLAYAAGLFSLLFSLAAWAAAVWFFRRRPSAAPRPGFAPAVTILKPLKGEDRELYANLESFCRQDYPEFQIIFTVASPDDPALAVVSRLRRSHPSLDIEVVVSNHRIGYNPKINNVSNASPFIKHAFLLLSDSDVRVAPDFLRRAVAPFRDRGVGLVTCFYQCTTPRGLWPRLEALSVNAQFFPQAVTAAAFGMKFAMGAAVLVRREAFERIGGFAALAGHLADDYVLGEAVQALGWRLEFSDAVVDSVPGASGAWEHLSHQARWARTIRLCQPAGYCGTLLLHGFSLLTLKLLMYGWDPLAAALAGALLAAKAVSKLHVSLRLLGGRQTQASLWLLPLGEWIAFWAWLSGFRAREVVWRGERYSVESRGRLVPSRPAPHPPPLSARP